MKLPSAIWAVKHRGVMVDKPKIVRWITGLQFERDNLKAENCRLREVIKEKAEFLWEADMGITVHGSVYRLKKKLLGKIMDEVKEAMKILHDVCIEAGVDFVASIYSDNRTLTAFSGKTANVDFLLNDLRRQHDYNILKSWLEEK